MKTEEESALRQILWDQFQLMADLSFERHCIDRATECLSASLRIIGAPMKEHEKLDALVAVLDDIRKHLNRRRDKS